MQSKRGLFVALALVSSLFAAGAYFLIASSADTAARDSQFYQQVRNAIAEISLTGSSDPASLAAASGSVAGFVSYRSGVLLSDHNLEALADSEALSLQSRKRITKENLAEILTSLAVGKLRNLTDAQKAKAIESMRGFYHPDLPKSYLAGRRFVSLRANGKGRMTAEEMSAQIESVRGRKADGKIVYAMIRNAAALEIQAICDTLINADRYFFGGTNCEMTPMQAYLVAYAVATDDLLAGNRADIAQKMDSIRTGAEAVGGAPYPDPGGATPYGPNGYVFSTPSDLLLDEATTSEFIKRISRITR